MRLKGGEVLSGQLILDETHLEGAIVYRSKTDSTEIKVFGAHQVESANIDTVRIEQISAQVHGFSQEIMILAKVFYAGRNYACYRRRIPKSKVIIIPFPVGGFLWVAWAKQLEYSESFFLQKEGQSSASDVSVNPEVKREDLLKKRKRQLYVPISQLQCLRLFDDDSDEIQAHAANNKLEFFLSPDFRNILYFADQLKTQ